MVNIYGNSAFDSPKIYQLVDGGSNGCSNMHNVRKDHHDIKKGIALLVKSGNCSFKKVIQHSIEAGAELVIIYLEYADDNVKDFQSTGHEGLSTPELSILAISNAHGIYFKQ